MIPMNDYWLRVSSGGNYLNEASNRYERFGKMATDAGFQPGSGEWWQALKKFRAAEQLKTCSTAISQRSENL